MLPPVFPKLIQNGNMPHMNVPNQNTIIIPGQTKRAAAYLVQAVVAPLPKLPKDPYANR